MSTGGAVALGIGAGAVSMVVTPLSAATGLGASIMISTR